MNYGQSIGTGVGGLSRSIQIAGSWIVIQMGIYVW